MKNIFLKISYNGSFYHGWQIQPNGVTVQQTLKEAIEELTDEKINLLGCSRTDSGVHAKEFCCNFKTNSTIPPEKFAQAINVKIPKSIVVLSSKQVSDDFHSRYDAKGKRYVYRLLNSKNESPFLDKLVYFYPYDVDADLMNAQAKDFIGTYDFSAFCASGSEVESKVRTIYDFSVERRGDEVVFTVSGDGFLYNMVRIMVGTLLDICSGKIEKGTVKDIIASKERSRAGVTVPGCGLYLEKVFYDEDI